VTSTCEHPLCEIIGGECSLATRRSRGCRPTLTSREIAPDVIDEVRKLVGMIDPEAVSDDVRVAAVRLAAIVRREALDDRNVVAIVTSEEPDLSPSLKRLCRRRRST
jgi:hypothetical protein